MTENTGYIPALGLRVLTPLYDPVLRKLFREEQIKRDLIANATIQPGQHVLDLGCGTGTLILMLNRLHPQAHVIGVDGDRDVLTIAQTKAGAIRQLISLNQALVSSLPYPDATFDRVLSSLVFHHLSSSTKQAALREIYRVLRDDGELHILDFGAPHTLAAKIVAPLIRHLEQVADNLDGLIPFMAHNAGFTDVTLLRQERIIAVATIMHLRARKSINKKYTQG